MQTIIKAIIKYLKRLLIYLEEKSLPITGMGDDTLNSLAPKIITEETELNKIQPYLNNLRKALQTKGINNIAVTGSYGSGKSTIIKTFQYHNRQFKYLNISLASFKDKKKMQPTAATEESAGDEEFEKKIEVSILQQIFYHVKPSIIPDSRFKRIINLTSSMLFWQTALLLLWALSSIILFKFEYINKLNPKTWSPKLSLDWFSLLLIAVFLTGIGLFVKSVVRLFSNSKISKINIKGEIELGDSVEKSVFNQHLEEIIYFFERTNFGVVVIEDVDRFNSTDIFTKLREINILINNSELINREIKFVYAVKDEMFVDKNERVKFFEFIIPIIPFINPSNAGDQLTRLINEANLNGILSADFTQDVTTFISDIDMRLLINIFQEYQLYRENLSKELNQDNLFAMIVYKNLYPDDFGNLPKRKGYLYDFLSNREVYITEIIQKLRTKIDQISTRIESIEGETEQSIKDLRSIYISKIVSKLDGFKSFFTTRELNITEILEENNFNKIKKNSNIYYTKFIQNTYQSQFYLLSNNLQLDISFSTIEKEVSKDHTYDQREKHLVDKANNIVDLLKTQKEDLKNEISKTEAMSIKEIFVKINIESYLKFFKEDYLMRNLLLNGYINEYYNDYISLFHEINMTKEDFSFERKVKSGVNSPFDYLLTKTENIIKRLPEKYFRSEPLLNFHVLEFLLENSNKYQHKIEIYFELLQTDNEAVFDFIAKYSDRDSTLQGLFINKLVKTKKSLWEYLKNRSGLPDATIRKLLKLVFTFGDYDDILNLKNINTLVVYIEEMPDPVNFFSDISKTETLKKFLKNKSVSISHLDIVEKDPANFFDFVYKSNLYRINPHNIDLIVTFYRPNQNLERLQAAYYSILKNLNLTDLLSYLAENIEEYFKNVMFQTPENRDEDENIVIEFLNNLNISNVLKGGIIELQNAVINNLENIIQPEIKELIITNSKVKPSWENVFCYYESQETLIINSTLVNFLNKEENYELLSKKKLNSTTKKKEEFIIDFSKKILYCKELKIEAYINLLKSIPYSFNNLEHQRLNTQKIEWMLSNKFLTLTKENFNGLKVHFKSQQIKLLEVYQDKFEETFSDYELEADDLTMIFKSKLFAPIRKMSILKKIDDSIIIQNAQLAAVVCTILPETEYIPLRFELLEALISSDNSLKKRITMLNLHFINLGNSQIKSLTEQLGDDYAKMFMKQHKPVFDNNQWHEELFRKLQSKELIKRYEVIENKNKIRVFANY